MARCTMATDNGQNGPDRLRTYQFNTMIKDKDGKERTGPEITKVEVKGEVDESTLYKVGKDYDLKKEK